MGFLNVNKYYIRFFLVATTIFLIFHFMITQFSDQLNAMKLGFYLQIFTLIIFIVTGLITVQNFKLQMEDKNKSLCMQYASLSQSKINEIDKNFLSNPLLHRLYLDLYLKDPQMAKLRKKIKDKDAEKNPNVIIAEKNMSTIIFHTVAEVYFIEKLRELTINNVEWYNTFKKWFKSPLLRKYWRKQKWEFHPEVIDYIDDTLINGKEGFFRYGKKNPLRDSFAKESLW